jgi:hypothetical protein
MKKIYAEFAELKNAFFVHSGSNTEEDSISYNLLLFYAVESGLKAIYLRMNPLLKNTNEIRDRDLRSYGGHSLYDWLKALKMPAAGIGNCQGFKLKRDKSRHNSSRVHEAWRYGIAIEPDDEKKLVEWLKGLKGIIVEELK